MKQKIYFAIFSVIVSLFIFTAADAQTTAFTYQGRLSDGANAAPTGAYDLQFVLYDAGGASIGGVAVIREDVAVTNGVFAVSLDFGATAFTGNAARFLEIGVRPGNSTGAFTVLAPRQAITSAPYAIQSLNAASVETTGGNSVVNSINNAATNATINSNRLSADVVRLNPGATQNATTTDSSAALLDATGTTTDSNNNVLGTSRIRFNFDGGLLLAGNSGFGTIPLEGAGSRLMWYPGKSAFRAGYVNGTQWDDANIGNYSTAFGLNSRASGENGFAAGRSATAANSSTVALGEGVTASGAGSVALGYGAHTNARQGTFVFADRSVPLVYDSSGNLDTTNSTLLRASVNHSANWRVSGGFRIFTSSNLSTGVTIQSGAAQSNWGRSNTVIDTSTGAYLSTSGVWTDNSSVNLKTNFSIVNSRDVLRKVLNLKIQTWNYKTDAPDIRHIGVMAQDFYRAFRVGADDEHLTAVDTAGVTMAAIQGVYEELNEREAKLQNENAALKANLANQQTQIERQQKQIDDLRRIVCALKSDSPICEKNK